MTSERDVLPDTAVRRFGAEMRRHRKSAGLSQGRLGERLGCSQGQISRLEKGQRTPSQDDAENLDRIFGLIDKKHFVGLYARISAVAGGPQWFAGWAEEIEPAATVLRTWDPLLVPGLLQTEAYAHSVFRGGVIGPGEVEVHVQGRMRRKLILNRDNPPFIWALIDEGVLWRRIGDAEVMREQMEYLLEVSEHHNVTVQVVPYNSPCTLGLLSSFALAQMPDGTTAVSIETAGPGVVSVENTLVMLVWSYYDRIRAVAHPVDMSLKLIKEIMDRADMDLTTAEWRKSSHSGATGGNCVEVATNLLDAVAVRDSKNPDAGALIFTPAEWHAFLGLIRTGKWI